MIHLGNLTAVDDSQPLQQVQVAVLADELLEAPRYQPEGFNTVPRVGSPCIVAFINGQRSQPVVLVLDDPTQRPRNGVPGERTLYANGASIVIKVNGAVEITPATGQPLTINGDAVVNGSLTATGDVADGVSTMQAMRDTYNTHTHGGAPPDQSMGG